MRVGIHCAGGGLRTARRRLKSIFVKIYLDVNCHNARENDDCAKLEETIVHLKRTEEQVEFALKKSHFVTTFPSELKELPGSNAKYAKKKKTNDW